MLPKGLLMGLLVFVATSNCRLSAQSCTAQINCGACNSGGFVIDCKCPIITNFPTTACCCQANGCSVCSRQTCADWTCLSQNRQAPLKQNVVRRAGISPHEGGTVAVPLVLAGFPSKVASFQQEQRDFAVQEYRDSRGILVSTLIKHSEDNIAVLEQTITNHSEYPLSTIALNYSLTLASGVQFALSINMDTFIGGAWLAPGKTWNHTVLVDQKIPSALRNAELTVQLLKLIGQPVIAESRAVAASYEDKWLRDLDLIRKVRAVLEQSQAEEAAIRQIKELLEKAREERACADAADYISYYIREPGKFLMLRDFVQRALRLN